MEEKEEALRTSSELRLKMMKVRDISIESVKGGHETILREELGELLQALSKRDRGKDTDEHVFEECCDVINTVMSECYEMGYSTPEIGDMILYKLNRALERTKKGELL